MHTRKYKNPERVEAILSIINSIIREAISHLEIEFLIKFGTHGRFA